MFSLHFLLFIIKIGYSNSPYAVGKVHKTSYSPCTKILPSMSKSTEIRLFFDSSSKNIICDDVPLSFMAYYRRMPNKLCMRHKV